MTTAAQAYAAIRVRLADPSITIPLYWQNERVTLPAEPAPFAYVEFTAESGSISSYGAGRGANRYRHPARVDAYVFVERGTGLDAALAHAEVIAARLRSFRDSDVSCFEATVYPGGAGSELKPPGMTSEVGNYFWAIAEIVLFYDLIG